MEPPSLLLDAEIQRIKDAEHLRMLSIGYDIVGAMTALFGCLGLLYVGMGALMLSGAFPAHPPAHPPQAHHASADRGGGAGEEPAAPTPPDPAPRHAGQRQSANEPIPAAFGVMVAAIGSVFVLVCWTVGGLTVYSGYCLQRRRHRILSFIMAGVNRLHAPYGTALGVCTFLVLQRPSVEALYRSSAGQPVPPARDLPV